MVGNKVPLGKGASALTTQKKIVFCFPYRGTAGGVNMMFIRLAKYLQGIGFDVSVVDYPDGRMSKDKNGSIHLIPYYEEEEVPLPRDSIIIFQSMTPWSIFPSLRIHDETRLFFISTLPANFYPVLPGPLRDIMLSGGVVAKLFWYTLFYKEFSNSKRFLTLIEKKQSHAALDTNIISNLEESFSIKLNSARIFPLFSGDISTNAYLGQSPEADMITVGWVGRIADFKVHILNKVINDLKQYSEEEHVKVKFVIIGQGGREGSLINPDSDNFAIKRVESVPPSELDDWLLKVDLLFAMGTSALDGARLGVPTVRLDYSYKKISHDYKYKFLYEIKGYSLGELIGKGSYQNGEHSMHGIFELLLKDRANLSARTYDFYNANHSLESSANMLVQFLESAQLTWGELVHGRVTSSWLYGLWANIR